MKIILSIIIVKYKSEKYLPGCLASIGKNPNWEVIVVDNDKENVGYAGGCNKGAKKARGKYLLFLNPDTLIFNGAIQRMAEFLKNNSSVGIVGPKIYSDDTRAKKQLSFCRNPGPITSLFVYSPLKKIWKNNPFWKKFIYFDKINSKSPLEVDSVSGAAMMVRKEVFLKIKGFDESFFFYFEDNNICLRAKKAGFKISFVPEAKIIHFGRGSTLDLKLADKHFRKSRFLFFRKKYGFLLSLILQALIRFLEKISEI